MPSTGPGTYAYTQPNGIVSVSVPATNLYTVNFYQDDAGQAPLASVAPGNSAFFSVTQGYFIANSPSGTSGFSITQVTTSGKIYELIGPGANVTNTTSETQGAVATIPANLLTPGQSLKVKFSGSCTGVTAAATLQFILRIGTATLTGTALITSTAVTATTSTVFFGEFTLFPRAAPGATAAMVGYGYYQNNGAVGAAVDGANLSTTNFATNGALLVEVNLVWSAASASNIAHIDSLEVVWS